MKISSIFYIVALVAGVAVQAHVDHNEFEARDWLDEFHARELVLDYHARAGTLEEFSTRDLVDELAMRLERRGGKLSKPKTYMCPYCSAKYATAKEAKDCSKFCKAK